MGASKKRLVADRFQIEAEAGAGGAGTVYRALDAVSGERVALKVLRGVVDAGNERFLREAKTLARVVHQSVVRHVAHGVTGDGEPYLAMEWLEGHDLRRHLNEEGLTIAQSVALGAELADALAAMHALGVVHRDVKPSNVFLVGPPGRRSERVKLIDLGLVRIEHVSQSLTRTGVAVGTPGYMAPEQARGERSIGPAADVFSLGCVLFKCLTGQAPFEGSHLVAVLTKVLLAQAPRVRRLRPDVPEALDALIARTLAKDPAGRPSSAAEVAAALRAILGGSLDPLDETPTPRSLRLGGLSESEQRIVAVLVVGSVADDGALREVAERFGAGLDRITGGGHLITATQDPSALDQAGRLARCALAIAAALPGAPLVLATGFCLGSGAGASGEAIQRAISLLAAQPAPGVVLDEVTAALLDGRFEVVARGGGHLLVGHRDAALAARTLLGRPTPCLGREWELSTIASQLGDAVEESRAVALVFTAPTGVGKSRLAMEAVEAARSRRPDLEVWVGRAEVTQDDSPLSVLGRVVSAACELHQGDPPAELARKIAERVAGLCPAADRERIAGGLGEIVGLPPSDPGGEARGARVDPQLAADRTRRAWIDFLAATTAARPVLVVLDDLQWADGPSIRSLEAALANLEHAPWMVLALARPEVDERFPRLWAGRNTQRLRLKPLSRKPAERLVRLALGEVGEGVAERVADRAEGNVFFLEELIRMVARHGGDAPAGSSPGAPPPEPSPDAPGPGGVDALPKAVIGVVQARLDGLDVGIRRLLRAASIYGEAFWPGAVTALLGGTSTPAEDWTEQLVVAELVAARPESRFPGQRELVFRNALLREGAYALLTERDRAAGHLLAVAWLEEHGEPDPLVLARHLERGGDAPRAAVHTLRAAERSLRAADLEVAAAHAARAVALGLPDAERLHALGLRCEAQTWAAAWADAAATATEVLALARPGSAPWARALVARQSHALGTGRFAEITEIVTTVWRTEPEPDAIGTVLSALASGMFFLCVGARFVVATRLLERVDALVQREPDPSPSSEGRANLCHLLVETLGSGDPARALSRGERASAAYRRGADPAHLAFAQLFLAIACWQIGDLDRARREMAAITAGPRAALTASVRDVYEALLLLDAGALDEARAVAARAEETARAHGTPSAQGDARWIRAEIALHEGDLPSAERDARAALDLLHGFALAASSIQTLLAAVLLAQGRAAEALDTVRAPLAALDEQGGHGFRAARTRLVAARALDAAGHPDEARQALRLARAALLTRAAGIADPDLARSFVTRVPENAETLALAEAWLGSVDDGSP